MKSTFLKSFRVLILVAVISVISAQTSQTYSLTEASETNQRSESHFVNQRTLIASEEPTFQERDIFQLVNYQREKHGQNKLIWDTKLAKLARYYSKKMAREDFFEHQDPDGNTIVERAEEFKIKGWLKIGENLFLSEGYITPVGEAVESWLDSPGHRHNMLDKDWTHTAIGAYEKRGLKTYITQVFMQK